MFYDVEAVHGYVRLGHRVDFLFYQKRCVAPCRMLEDSWPTILDVGLRMSVGGAIAGAWNLVKYFWNGLVWVPDERLVHQLDVHAYWVDNHDRIVQIVLQFISI